MTSESGTGRVGGWLDGSAWGEWWRIAVVAACTPVGLLLIAAADKLSFRGAPWAVPLFWAGLVVIVGSAAAVLWSQDTSRRDAIAVVLIVGLALYAAKILHSPTGLGNYDELLHYRSLDDLVRSGRMFSENTLLPISPFYPGLEVLTSTLMKVTGLGIFSAAVVIIGIARALMVLGIFLFLERIAEPPRLAALATLLYMACPSFVYFDGMFAYESLALPLAVFCLFALRAAQLNEGGKRIALNAAGIAAGLATVVTHHVTSIILAATLLLWTVTTWAFRRRNPEPLPAGGWGPVIIFAAVVGWVLAVARAVVGYLWPHVVSAMTEFARIVAGENTSRRLFESSAGIKSPLIERLVGLGSVVLIAGCIPFGLYYLWKRQRKMPLAWMLAIGGASYPALMLLRFTKHGWDVGSRAMAFVYIPLALVLVGGLELLRNGRLRTILRGAVIVPLIVVVFAGGVIAGSSPSNRLPLPYRAGSGEISIDAETIAAAEWARDVLGPGNRIAADATNASIMGSYGRQRVVTSADGVSITGLFLSPGLGTYQIDIIRKARIQYVVVDRRIAGVVPLKGYFYEKWEKDIVQYGSTVSTETLSRFDVADEVSRVYDSGDIQIYDVSRLGR